MSNAAALSPAEKVVLLSPNTAKAMAAIKVTLLFMLTKGVLRIEQTEQPGFFRNKTVAHLRIAAEPKEAPPEIAALLDVVRAAQADGGAIKDVVKQAEKAFGPNCMQFTLKFVTPALIARGLLVEKKILFTRLWRLTPAGDIEQSRLKSELFHVNDMFKLVTSDPAQAAALAAALGTTILISDKLPRHLKPLADAMRERGGNAGGDAGLFVAGDDARHGDFHHGNFHHDLAGAIDFSSFDLGSFDFSAFDSAASTPPRRRSTPASAMAAAMAVTAAVVIISRRSPDFAERVIGPATSGRTRWRAPSG
jgi:hypothetical protein